jgi:hypothetical protein
MIISIDREWFDQSKSISIEAQWLISSFEIELFSDEANHMRVVSSALTASGTIMIILEWIDQYRGSTVDRLLMQLGSLSSTAIGIKKSTERRVTRINLGWIDQHRGSVGKQI